MRRALAAQAQPGASLPEDLTTLLLAADSGAGRTASRRYHLRFASGQLPPAGAFWSLAAYDAQGLLAPNALNRQALGSRDPLRYNEDGSLDLVLRSARARAAVNQLAAAAGLRTRAIAAARLPAWPGAAGRTLDAATAAGGNAAEVTAEAALAPAAPATDPAPETGASAPAASATTATSSVLATPPAKPAVQGRPAASTVPAGPLTGGVAAVPAQAWPAPSAREKTAARPASRYHIHFSNQERPTWTTPSATNCR